MSAGQDARRSRRRWMVLGIFVLSSSINYLDRQALATLAPLLRAEFHLTNADYGWILSAFSLPYAVAAPAAGLLIDRIGLTRAITFAIGLWSCAGIATGFTRGLADLAGCRAILGVAEAAGVPAAGKAIHRYLKPGERALGNAVNQAAISFGMILAPPLATWMALAFGWRRAFIATGIFGLLWIPLWKAIARKEGPSTVAPGAWHVELLRSRRLWAYAGANAVSMVLYSLWTNWTTLYLVNHEGLTLAQAAWYAWIPPLFATLGGFAGGWLSLGWMKRGMDAVSARTRACAAGAILALSTAAIPLLSGAPWAAAGISLSIFSVAAFSVNLYTMPLDSFGGDRAAMAVSMLVSSYGLLQTGISPLFGAAIDTYGYGPVCSAAAFTPLAALVILKLTANWK